MDMWVFFRIYVILFCVAITICQSGTGSKPKSFMDECLEVIKEPLDTDVTKLGQFKLGLYVGCMNDLPTSIINNQKQEINKYRRAIWKVVPRVFLDDIEAEYKPLYDAFLQDREKLEAQHRRDYEKQTGQNDPYKPLFPQPADWPRSDPKAIRIREKADMWFWFLTNFADKEEFEEILKLMEISFRQKHEPPIAVEEVPLTGQLADEFERFKKKTCKAIGIASESLSFIIHGDQALDLFKGELKELNVYGPKVDPYLVPIFNAVLPLLDENKDFAVFMET